MMTDEEELAKLEVELKEMDHLNSELNKYFLKKCNFVN